MELFLFCGTRIVSIVSSGVSRDFFFRIEKKQIKRDVWKCRRKYFFETAEA